MQVFKSMLMKIRPKQQALMEARFLLSDTLFEEPPPPNDHAELESITASEAVRQLSKGKALIQKRIKGDLIIGKEDLRYNFEFEMEGQKIGLAGISAPPEFERLPIVAKIEVKGCLFEGRVQLAGLWFEEEVLFSGTTFQANVEFHYSTFAKSAIFHQCQFEKRAKFGDSCFFEMAHFDRSTFCGRTDFYNVKFDKGAGFGNAIFRAPCNLSHARFYSSEILQPCLDFRNAVCHEAVYISGAECVGIADFSDAQFHRKTDFADASFQYVNFTNAEFGRLDLKWEQIAGEKLLFGKLFLNLEPGRAVINRDEFNELFERREEAPLSDKHRQYDILKAIFTKQGDHVSADGCYYEWKQVERRQSRLGVNPERWMIKAFHYLNWLSCGYGVKPIRTLLFALATILIFAVAHLIVDPAIGVALSGASGIGANTPLWVLLFRKLELSFLSFMSFGGIQSGLSPAAQILYWSERLLGWVTLVLFLTTYRRLMER